MTKSKLIVALNNWTTKIPECHVCKARINSIVSQSNMHDTDEGLKASLEYAQRLYCPDCKLLCNAMDDSIESNRG